MKIEHYKNLSDEDMVLILDENANKSESMTLATYEQRLADQEKQSGTL